jgi:hypothetical protein
MNEYKDRNAQILKLREELDQNRGKGVDIMTITVSELYNMCTDADYQIDFEKYLNSSGHKKNSPEIMTQVIESLILEFPQKPCVFTLTHYPVDRKLWQVIENGSRIRAVLQFMGYPRLGEPLKLSKPSTLFNLEGLTYSDLPTDLKMNFKRSRVPVILLETIELRYYYDEFYNDLYNL